MCTSHFKCVFGISRLEGRRGSRFNTAMPRKAIYTQEKLDELGRGAANKHAAAFQRSDPARTLTCTHPCL